MSAFSGLRVFWFLFSAVELIALIAVHNFV